MKIKNFGEIIVFFVLTFLFTVVIFLSKNFLFISEDLILEEEKFIEPINLEASKQDTKDVDFEKILAELKEIEKQKRKEKIYYNYIPFEFSFEEKIKNYINFFDTFFLSNTINSKLNFLQIDLYKETGEVRGKLKNKKIHLFGVYKMPKKEALSVSIHEFGHFLDLYILKKNVFKDPSDDFYNISWQDTSVLKPNSYVSDFVSGYAMTNKYEDFAESFNFYVLHNEEFLKKAQKSEKLQQKYNFFNEYIFTNYEFKSEQIGAEIEKDYLWDTTKIDFDYEKLKKHLETYEEEIKINSIS